MPEVILDALRRQVRTLSPEQLDAWNDSAMDSPRVTDALQRDIDAAEDPERWDLCG